MVSSAQVRNLLIDRVAAINLYLSEKCGFRKIHIFAEDRTYWERKPVSRRVLLGLASFPNKNLVDTGQSVSSAKSLSPVAGRVILYFYVHATSRTHKLTILSNVLINFIREYELTQSVKAEHSHNLKIKELK